MKSIAYSIGWDKATLLTDKRSPEYDPHFDPIGYANSFAKEIFRTKKEREEFKQGILDFLQYNIKKREEERKDEEYREYLEERLYQLKEKKKSNFWMFLMALHSGNVDD